MSATEEVPPGFGPLPRSSPLLELLGPFHAHGQGRDLVIGLRVAAKHANGRGTLHGGVIATLADVALGYATSQASDPPVRLITASLSVDYLGAARIGDWLETRIEFSRSGGTLAFANAYIESAGRPIARASAVFAVSRATP